MPLHAKAEPKMDDQNPFASPAETAFTFVEPVRTPDGKPQLRIASQGKRFANYLVDWLLLQLASVVVGVGLAIAGLAEMADGIGGYAIGLLLWTVYYFTLEMAGGRTIGKLITGTKVVNEFGEQPTAGQILGRTLSRFIPFEAFSFFGGKGRPVGWHDSLSGTRVVQI